MVFQYPEYQLFESTVIKDVSFGPKNIGMKKLDIEFNSYEALKMVGIGEDLLDVSPFELSGGQKRRVAIAGVLAMKPEVIILDEPAAGLDILGKEKIFDILKEINKKNNTTIVFISHNMEDVVQYADRVIVLGGGSVLMDGKVRDVFARKDELKSLGMGVIPIAELFDILKKNGMSNLGNPLTIEEALEELFRYEMENC
jgi:energy-coupling factor transport system ATP-binding protein